jgi:ribosomal protein S18 acetylase RimI-like enzyme
MSNADGRVSATNSLESAIPGPLMEYRLRRALESDKAFLYSLHCATMREIIEKTWGWDEAWQRANFDERFEEQLVSIIEAAGRDAGGLWLQSTQEVLYIADLQILPELQGRGLGTSVLQGLIADATARRVPLELAVLRANPRARRLYARLGFTVIEEGDPVIRMRHHSRQIGAV